MNYPKGVIDGGRVFASRENALLLVILVFHTQMSSELSQCPKIISAIDPGECIR
jgi:hypothetical protein